jgi:murein DD-endopeptidase MepM/ murein hydrolase activator NlpD
MRVIEIAPAVGTPLSAAEPGEGVDPLQLARDQAHLGVQMVTALVRRAGMNPDRALAAGLAAEAASAQEGGPFVPVRASIDIGLFQMQSDLSHYGATAGRLADLMRLVRSMPLGRPLPEYEVVSGFGPRRDPFNNQPAWHNGVDLRAEAGTPVTTTAPGVVTMAETNGEFGNLVEVAHGFGLRTRYGHLSRITVARGDRIEAGQTVGLVGSTGRSTGPHLHYEILFQQASLDPLKFLEVSRHVLANVQRRFE